MGKQHASIKLQTCLSDSQKLTSFILVTGSHSPGKRQHFKSCLLDCRKTYR